MGIVKTFITKKTQKAADRIAKLSSLSPHQLEIIQQKREEYLSQKPDLQDSVAEEQTNRLLAAAGTEIFNAYLPQLSTIYTPVENQVEFNEREFKVKSNICYVKLTKWVIDSKENSLEKLVNVYEVLSNENCNIGLIFHREHNKTDAYLSVTNNNNSDDMTDLNMFMDRLIGAVNGNFPGSEFFVFDKISSSTSKSKQFGRLPCFNDMNNYSVASITNVPTEKSEKFFNQTIEKLLDGIVPTLDLKTEYTIILLATPILDIEERKLHLMELYSELAPFAGWQTSFTFTESSGTSSMATFGLNLGTNAGTQKGISESQTFSHSEAHTKGFNASIGGSIGSVNRSVGGSLGGFLSRTVMNTASRGFSIARNFNLGSNFGVSFARASNVSATVGKNESIMQNFTNYNIKYALQMLETQMKRLEKSSALGYWDFAAYVLSEDINVVNNVAHTYLALTQGDESFISKSAINLWRGDVEEECQAKEICSYLMQLRHPVFAIDPNVLQNAPEFNVYPSVVTATTGLSGKELSYSLNFPQKSISGLPVIECASFGRNISKFEEEKDKNHLKLGNIYHMHRIEDVPCMLDINSLCAHTFITGSTGSGKSNTVYNILNKLTQEDEFIQNNRHFLVVEPAKGEYKNVFGNRQDVEVYSTNQSIANLLRINPFSFPNNNEDETKNIHILEHLDRLIEIFNVCWPMYAAMPAVLKEAVEKSYEDVGWNLTTSVNEYGNNLYPTFTDVIRNIKVIIENSEYDAENKGAYKGSLITRLKSLTNGINGQVFTTNEISNERLFDENVIIDLSRVGSLETKSLIMGILVLKLQEYRMTSGVINGTLQHVTVLEEAHNLLKKPSGVLGQDGGGSLATKSVEMLTNSIAEMRTYGEGFIIADQAPGLLDSAVIRNTNTKIIMRLPDQGDRELVGKAANLNDDQITELAKLPKGVAAIYQNEWIEPVLCKVEKVDISSNKYEFVQSVTSKQVDLSDYSKQKKLLNLLFSGKSNSTDLYLKDLQELKLSAYAEVLIRKYIETSVESPKFTELSIIVKELFPVLYEKFKQIYSQTTDVVNWTDELDRSITQTLGDTIDAQLRRDIRQCIILQYVYNELGNTQIYKEWIGRGVK